MSTAQTMRPALRSAALVLALVAAGAVLLLSGASNVGLALRGLSILGGLLALLVWARKRDGGAATAPRIALQARHPLTRDVGVAILRVDGAQLVVGYGRDGVRLLAKDEDAS
jgi:hypothetical protein